MTRMIPPHLGENATKSAAERAVFDALERIRTLPEWTAKFSLGITRHQTRPEGECDFVIIAPNKGIAVLEVKGGIVSRQGGVWIFNSRSGAQNQKDRGPFEQARDGMWSLREELKRHFGPQSPEASVLMTYAVVFPDMTTPAFDVPDIETWQVAGRKQLEELGQWLEVLFSRHLHKVREKTGMKKEWLLPTERETERVVSFIAGDFLGKPAVSDEAEITESKLLSLTDEQLETFRDGLENDRIICRGGAGTGKTVLAERLTQECLSRGERVALLCFNKFLASELQRRMKFTKPPAEGGVWVGTFHQYLVSLTNASVPTGDPTEFFKEKLPDLGWEELAGLTEPPFDRLIIDEAQDLICPKYLDVFDAMVRGGLREGKWILFGDFHRQAIFSALSAEHMFNLVRDRGNYTRHRLRKNCRNTDEVFNALNALIEIDADEFRPSGISGPQVHISFFATKKKSAPKLTELLDELVEYGVQPKHITVLSPRRYELSSAYQLPSNRVLVLPLHESSAEMQNSDQISFATIHSFKGLENRFIVLTDIESVGGEGAKELLYVGMSRAQVGLYLLLPKELESEVSRLRLGEAVSREGRPVSK